MKQTLAILALITIVQACGHSDTGGGKLKQLVNNSPVTSNETKQTQNVEVKDDFSNQFENKEAAEAYVLKLKDFRQGLYQHFVLDLAPAKPTRYEIKTCANYPTNNSELYQDLKKIRSALIMTFGTDILSSNFNDIIEVMDQTHGKSQKVFAQEFYLLINQAIANSYKIWVVNPAADCILYTSYLDRSSERMTDLKAYE